MVDYPKAQPAFVSKHRVFIDQNTHYAIVIHKTASGGSAYDIANFFEHDPAMASVHYVVGQDGSVVQCVLEKDGAGGNCCVEPGYHPIWKQFVDKGINLNTVTLSIEHVDPSPTNSTPLTAAQKAASFELVKYLTQKYQIPTSRILGHHTINPINRANCPGNYPWAELFSYLEGETKLNGKVPEGWTDDGTRLKGPNGVEVILGFRDWVLSHIWDAKNYPLHKEVYLDPLEESNPGLGAGTRQVFRETVLEWTKARGVFVAWVGQEFLAVQADRDNLRKTVGNLQAELNAVKSGLLKADIQPR